MVLSSRFFGAEGPCLMDPARIVAPRPRWRIAAAAARVRVAGEGAARLVAHPAARAALADWGAYGVEAARLLSDQSAEADAVDACLWRWALADEGSLSRALARAAALDQALSPAFARFLDDMLGATPSASYEALRRAVRRLQAFPLDAHARAAVLTQVETFGFAMMTGPVALRAAVDWALREMGETLVAPARPLAEAAHALARRGFQDLDGPAAYAARHDEDDDDDDEAARAFAAPVVAEWLAQPSTASDPATRRALAAAGACAASSVRLEAALETAAARCALAEAPEADDLAAATRDVCDVIGAPFIARAAGSPPAVDRELFAAAFAAFASRPIDARALRAGRAERCDMTIRFEAAASRFADAARVRPLRGVFGALYASGAASALAEVAAAHACVRSRIAGDAPRERVEAGAHLIDMAGFAPRALRAGLALRRLCEAHDGAFAHAWRAPRPHASFLERAFATA